MREIGSEFWLERKPAAVSQRDGCYVLSGRTAIDLIIQDIAKTRAVRSVYMPAWGCDSMIAPFSHRDIHVDFYDVRFDGQLKCHTDFTDNTDILYVTNYFGYENTLPIETIKEFKAKGAIILYDRTHSFLMENDPYLELADYSFASIRKWMGVIGGAVVNGVKDYKLKPCPYLDCKEQAMRMKKAFIEGESSIDKLAFLSLYGEFGHHLAEDYQNYEMDDLSYALYGTEDFAAMRHKRRENAKYLHEHLKGVRFLGKLTDNAVPLFVPVFFDTTEQRNAVRKKLIEAQIYCPIHWPKPAQIPADFAVNKIYNTELSLICDQRYGMSDMQRIVETIKQFIMKTLLITGIGGLTPRSIATVIREKYPHYHVIGIDADKKAMGFFMYTKGKKLVDEYFVCPRCDSPEYFPFIERLVAEMHIDYAFVQPEAEIVEWGDYYEKHGKFPCEVFMGCKLLSESLRDKAIMASLLEGTDFIPKTIKVTQKEPKFDEVQNVIGFPCWIRATEGTGGLGSLRLDNLDSYKSWLFINSRIEEFTVSEFLTGRHLANQMLYYNNEYVKGAALECAEYVMANTAPSHVTGNTHFARFLNEDRINKFCDNCIKYLCNKLNVPAHGILSFDLKEDKNGKLKVTEVNIRHMAYTGVMTRVGFDLIGDTMTIMEDGNADRIVRDQYHHYEKPYIFLRDVDVEPIVLESEEIFENMKG